MSRIHPAYSGPLVFGGTAGRQLASRVCEKLNIKEGRLEIARFSDGETGVKILDNVRGADCYLIQPTCSPVNEHLMEMLLCVDAMRRASAERINVIVPYFGYARQDRKDQGRVALSAKLVANLIATSGADRVICMDLHSAQIQGFFDLPMDHLYGAPVLQRFLHQQTWEDKITVVSPDVGNVKMCRGYASALETDLAIIDKRRPKANVSEVMNVIGEARVKDRHCLLVDDLIDTAGTLCNAAQALLSVGAKSVSAVATHGVLSGPALERLEASPIDQIIVTNSINQTANCSKLSKLTVVDISSVLAEAVHRIHNFLSVSAIFEDDTVIRRAEEVE